MIRILQLGDAKFLLGIVGVLLPTLLLQLAENTHSPIPNAPPALEDWIYVGKQETFSPSMREERIASLLCMPDAICMTGVIDVVLDGSGQVSATDIINAVDDNSIVCTGSLSINIDNEVDPSFDCTDAGTTFDGSLIVDAASLGTSNCDFQIRIVDTEAPQITCPSLPGSVAGVLVFIPFGSALDGVSWQIEASDNSIAASGLATGSSVLTIPFNLNCDDTYTFSLTDARTTGAGMGVYSLNVDGVVLVTNDPISTTTQNIVVNPCAGSATFTASAATGTCAATFNNLAPIASDNCDPPTLTYAIMGDTERNGNGDASGSFNVGTSTVTYTVSDGNQSVQCSVTIEVTDDEDPTVTCPAGRGVSEISIGFRSILENDAGTKITWEIRNQSNEVLASGGPYTATGSGPFVTSEKLDLPCDGMYSLIINNTGANFDYSFGGDVVEDITAVAVTAGTPMTTQAFTTPACDPGITVNVDAGQCTASNIAATIPTFSDNCPNPVINTILEEATNNSVQGADASSLSFNVGKTKVIYIVGDGTNSARCDFNVFVVDNTTCGCANPQPGDVCDLLGSGDGIINDNCECAQDCSAPGAPTENPSLALDPDQNTFCNNDEDPQVLITGDFTDGGDFSASDAGVVIYEDNGNYFLDLSATFGVATMAADIANPKSFMIVYTSMGTNSACPGIASVNVTIQGIRDVSLPDGPLEFCIEDAIADVDYGLTLADNSSEKIVATGNGIVSSSVSAADGQYQFDPSVAGFGDHTITIRYSVEDNQGVELCFREVDRTFTVNGATLSYAEDAYCSNDIDPIPTVNSNNVLAATNPFSADPSGLSINPSTGEIDVSASTPNTYTVTYQLIGESGCESPSTTVTINSLEDAGFSYAEEAYCANANDPTPTITGGSGGTFTAMPTGLSINASTGQIDLSASTPNTYSITYTTAGTCPNSSSVSLTVNAVDDAGFSYTMGSYCINDDSDPVPTITGVSGGTFSALPSGLSINTQTGEIDLSTSTPNTYSITYTTNGICPNSSSVEVIIIPTPTVDQPNDQTLCPSEMTSLIDFIGTATAFKWTNDNPSIGLADAGEGDIPAFEAINTGNTAQVANIVVTPEYSQDGNTCTGDSKSFTITVNPTPVLDAIAPITICSEQSTTFDIQTSITENDQVNYLVEVFGNVGTFDMGNTTTGLPTSGATITFTAATNVDSDDLVGSIRVTSERLNCKDVIEFDITVQPEPVIIPDTKWICSYERSELNIRQRNTISIDRLVINSVDLDGAVLVDGPEYLEGDEPSFSPDMFASQIYQYEGDGFANIVYNVTPISSDGCAGNPVNVQINVEFCPVSCNREVRVTLGDFAQGRSSNLDQDCIFPLDIQNVASGKTVGIRFGYYILVNDRTPGDNIITSPGTFQYAILQDIGFDGDPSNDINICWGTVIAEDKSDPVVMPPSDKYLECWLLDDVLNNPGTVAPAGDGDGENSDPATFDGGDGDDDNDLGFPKVTDGCEGHSIPFKWSDAVVYYDCDSPYDTKDYRVTAVLTRRFSAADAQGNETTATQTIYFVGPRTSIDGDNNVTSVDYWGWGPLVDPSDRDGDGVKFYYDVEAGLWVYTLQSCDAPSEQVGELYPYYTGQLDCETGQFNQLIDIDPAPDNVVLGPDYRDAFGNKVRLDEVNCNLSVQTDNRQFSDVCSDGSYKQERHLRIFDWCEGSSDGTAFPYLVKVGDFAPPVLDNCVLNPLDVPGVRRRTNFGDAETVIELLNGDTDGDGDLENDQIRPEHIEAGQITFFDEEDEELKDEGYTVSVCLEMVSTGPMDCTASLNTDLGALRALWGKQLVQDCEDPTVTSEIYSYSEVYVGGFPTGEYAWQIGGYSMVGTMAVGIPEGLHALVFSATDNCYNSTLGMIFFTVMDGTKPVMKCDDELRVTLVDGDPKLQIQGYALATAQDVDEGSWDNCGPVDLHVRRIINDADVQADWEAKNGRLLIDEYDDNDPDYNQGYTGWDDLVEFFCGDLDEKVTVELRGSDTKKIWRKCIENCGGSTSDDVYIYSIFRKTQEQQDDGWVHVKTPNQSVCWLEVEVENGTNYTVELDGGGTALCTEDFNADDFITVTYLGLQCASPDIEVVVEPELDQCGIGRYKIYLQDNTDVESKNRPNVDPNPVYVYVRPYHDYWIKFPKDAIYDCGADQEVGGVETSADLEIGCDLLAISTLPDERFAATSDPDACYKIFRTYRVINWCEYDGQQEPVVVSRDWDSWNGFDFGTSTTSDDRDPNARREYNINPQFPDGDDNPGNTDLYVIVKRNLNDDLVDRVFYDADSDPTANVGEVSTDQPRFGSNGSGNTDVETYWWQVTSGSRGIVDLAPAGNSSNDYFGDTEANEPDWDLDTNNESYYDGSYRGEPVRWGYDPNVSNADPNGSANDSSDNDDDDQYYGSVGFWQYTQHIIVYDDTAPEVRVEAEQECAINGETCDAETSFDIVITDVCSLDDITVKVYVNGEAASNVALNATDTAVIATVTGRRGLGNYKISGEVNDGCGNITPFDGELEVVDCKAPAPICQNGMVVELMPADAGGQQGNTSGSAGMNVLWAKDFIGSPVGDCSGQGPEEVLVGNDQYLPMITKYSINRLDSAVADSLTSLVVTCADEGLMVEVEIHAWDELGNHDFCRTSIIVQDNNGVCNLSGATGNIAGVIETEQAAKLEGVEVQLSGAQSRMYMTGQLGDYGFDNLSEGHDFSVIPTKDDDHKNGISTFDLILIQKHILGIAPLESPYQLIAADANNSKSVSTLDLIQIRKLILNIDTELANNTSWRFVDADYTFPNEGNPWQEAFPEIRNINNLEGEQIVNFIAVKVGDVNNSANVEARSKQGVFVINTKEQVMTRGNEYTIEFTADLAKIAGYQFTLDVKQAEIVDIIYGAASAEHFGVFPKQGIITTSFNSDLEGENHLFSIKVRSLADVKVSDAISINSRFTAAGAYADTDTYGHQNHTEEPLNVTLNFEGQTETSGEFVLNQNTPNPFLGETLIGFNLPEPGEATITLKDVSGRTIKVIEGDFTKGYNQIRVKSNELPARGVFFYTLTVGELTATKKMIISE